MERINSVKRSENFSFPYQCIWIKLNGSWPINSQNLILRNAYTLWSFFIISIVGITIYFQATYLVYSFGDILKVTENCSTTFMGFHNFIRLIHLRLNQKHFKKLIDDFVQHIWVEKLVISIQVFSPFIIITVISYYKWHYGVVFLWGLAKVNNSILPTNIFLSINIKLMENPVMQNTRTQRGTDAKIEKRCKNEMVIFKIMSVMLFALICMYCILPMFELFADVNAEEKPFPYKMIFPYNANSGVSYILTYIMTAYAGVAVVTTLFAEDTLFGFCVTYACAQFKLLHKKIQDIVPNGYENALSKYRSIDNIPEKYIQREYHKLLKDIAKKHDTIIKFCHDLDAFYSPILLVNFTTSSILICVIGFQIVTGTMSIGNYAKFILYILSSLGQLFILCWNGNNIIQKSTETAWSLYSCNWEGGLFNIQDENFGRRRLNLISYPPGGNLFNRNLSFMILRSLRPVKITALKFSILSLQSFTTILSSSMSYFTLLQTLLESE